MIGNYPAFCSSLVMAPQLVAATGVQQKLILRAIDHLASTCGVELPVPRRCVRRVRARLGNRGLLRCVEDDARGDRVNAQEYSTRSP